MVHSSVVLTLTSSTGGLSGGTGTGTGATTNDKRHPGKELMPLRGMMDTIRSTFLRATLKATNGPFSGSGSYPPTTNDDDDDVDKSGRPDLGPGKWPPFKQLC